MSKFRVLVNEFTGREASPQKMDPLQQEIYHLEQSLIEIATRPNRVIRNPQPITEQQKILDLAG